MGRKNRKPIIALVTDFGTRDWFVGAMKGMIAHISPEIHVIDVTHDIAAQSVHEGAFALLACYKYFPPGTVFCVVVDPGVGSEREAIVASDGRYFFVAPNNGVLSFVGSRARRWHAFGIAKKQFVLPKISSTFHGRDVFAPAAAHLALNRRPHLFGPPVKRFVAIPFPKPDVKRDEIRGEVIYIDRFGNLVTNILRRDMEKARIGKACRISVGRKHINGFSDAYADVARGKPLAYWGSSDFLEIAVSEGSAARFFRARHDTIVSLNACLQ